MSDTHRAVAPRRNQRTRMRYLAGAFVVLAFGCATPPTEVEAPEPDPTGRLEVSIVGLPSGVAADVSVRGPAGFTRDVTAGSTFSDLATGSYTVSAAPIVADGVEYLPDASTRSVTVGADEVQTVVVTYQPQLGALAVSVEGLPDGVDADVRITGPHGFERSLTESESLTDVPAGEHTVAGLLVDTGTDRFSTGEGPQTVTVVTGEMAAVTIAYGVAPTTGTIALDLVGLPDGVDGSVQVIGPNGFNEMFVAGATLSDLEPGGYSVTAQNVTGPDQRTYGRFPLTESVIVEAGVTTPVEVRYGERFGQVAIAVRGLPAGMAGDVRLTGGPNGIDEQAGVHTNLPTGDYTITAAPVQQGGVAWWDPDVTSQIFTVEANSGGTVEVTYAPRVATVSIDITINGLPAGVDANARVIELIGDPFEEFVPESRLLEDLPRNDGYRVVARGVEVGGTMYAPNFNMADLFFVGTDRETVVVEYRAFTLTGEPGVLATNGYNICALDGGGLPYCWGGDLDPTPAAVSGTPAFTSVVVGADLYCGVTGAGAAHCWGEGFLGDGQPYGVTPPAQAAGGAAMTKLALSQAHACYLDLGGSAWCWGANDRGQLGNGAFGHGQVEYSPVQVSGGLTFVDISVSQFQTCAIDDTGDAWCWGYPPIGSGSATPERFGEGGDGFQRLIARQDDYGGQCALRGDGSWGCFGRGQTSALEYLPYSDRARGRAHVCGVRLDGVIECRGTNNAGQLGSSDTAADEVLIDVASFVAIESEVDHSCALSTTGDVYCWGDGVTTPTVVFSR